MARGEPREDTRPDRGENIDYRMPEVASALVEAEQKAERSSVNSAENISKELVERFKEQSEKETSDPRKEFYKKTAEQLEKYTSQLDPEKNPAEKTIFFDRIPTELVKTTGARTPEQVEQDKQTSERLRNELFDQYRQDIIKMLTLVEHYVDAGSPEIGALLARALSAENDTRRTEVKALLLAELKKKNEPEAERLNTTLVTLIDKRPIPFSKYVEQNVPTWGVAETVVQNNVITNRESSRLRYREALLATDKFNELEGINLQNGVELPGNSYDNWDEKVKAANKGVLRIVDAFPPKVIAKEGPLNLFDKKLKVESSISNEDVKVPVYRKGVIDRKERLTEADARATYITLRSAVMPGVQEGVALQKGRSLKHEWKPYVAFSAIIGSMEQALTLHDQLQAGIQEEGGKYVRIPTTDYKGKAIWLRLEQKDYFAMARCVENTKRSFEGLGFTESETRERMEKKRRTAALQEASSKKDTWMEVERTRQSLGERFDQITEANLDPEADFSDEIVLPNGTRMRKSEYAVQQINESRQRVEDWLNEIETHYGNYTYYRRLARERFAEAGITAPTEQQISIEATTIGEEFKLRLMVIQRATLELSAISTTFNPDHALLLVNKLRNLDYLVEQRTAEAMAMNLGKKRDYSKVYSKFHRLNNEELTTHSFHTVAREKMHAQWTVLSDLEDSIKEGINTRSLSQIQQDLMRFVEPEIARQIIKATGNGKEGVKPKSYAEKSHLIDSLPENARKRLEKKMKDYATDIAKRANKGTLQLMASEESNELILEASEIQRIISEELAALTTEYTDLLDRDLGKLDKRVSSNINRATQEGNKKSEREITKVEKILDRDLSAEELRRVYVRNQIPNVFIMEATATQITRVVEAYKKQFPEDWDTLSDKEFLETLNSATYQKPKQPLFTLRPAA